MRELGNGYRSYTVNSETNDPFALDVMASAVATRLRSLGYKASLVSEIGQVLTDAPAREIYIAAHVARRKM